MNSQKWQKEINNKVQSYTDRQLIYRALILTKRQGKKGKLTELGEWELLKIYMKIDKRFKIS